MNRTWLLLSISDWPIIMIGPCGFAISSPPNLFGVSVSVLWMRFLKWISKLGCEKYFCKVTTHTLHRLTCSSLQWIKWLLLQRMQRMGYVGARSNFLENKVSSWESHRTLLSSNEEHKCMQALIFCRLWTQIRIYFFLAFLTCGILFVTGTFLNLGPTYLIRTWVRL